MSKNITTHTTNKSSLDNIGHVEIQKSTGRPLMYVS